MDRAIELACKGARSGAPFGAVIVFNDKIVGEGYNHVKQRHDPTAHAEMLAIQDACKNLKTISLQGAVMYSSCEPCPMCKAALQWANIEKVYYGVTQKYAERILKVHKNPNIVMVPIHHSNKKKPLEILKKKGNSSKTCADAKHARMQNRE